MKYTSKANSKLLVVLTTITILGSCFTYLIFSESRLTNKNIWADEWDYQVVGVNMAHGFGFESGKVLPFEAYHLNKADHNYYNKFMKSSSGHSESYLRPPAYIFSISLIYRLAGVQPILVKKIQASSMVILFSLLPFVCASFLGRAGFLAGLATSFLTVKYLVFQGIAYRIMPEVLQLWLICAILLLGFLLSKKRSSVILAVLLGVSLALGALTKEQMFMLPFLVLSYLGAQTFFGNNKIKKKVFIPVLLGFVIPVSVYSTYISITAGKFIPVMSRGAGGTKVNLLMAHNEFVHEKISWNLDWNTNPDSFYNQNKQKNDPLGLKVIFSLYSQYPEKLPFNIGNSLNRTFGVVPFLTTGVFLLTLFILRISFLPQVLEKKKALAYFFGILVFLSSMFLFKVSFSLAFVFLTGSIVVGLFTSKFREALKMAWFNLNGMLALALFLNIFIFIFFLIGNPRYVTPFGFIFYFVISLVVVKMFDELFAAWGIKQDSVMKA